MLPLLVTLLALPGNLPRAVEVCLPSNAALVEAARARDDVELERLARRLGPSRLARLARGGRRAERLAALRALPLVDGAWAEIGELATLLGDPDGELAEAVARALGRIADGLSAETIYAEEIPSDVPLAAARALFAVAARGELRPPLRASSVRAATALWRLGTPGSSIESALTPLLSDEAAAVRRAAVDGLDARVSTKLLEAALGDADPSVAAAAGAALCASEPQEALPGVAKALDEPSRERVRALAGDERLAASDRLDLIPCLRAFGSADDKKLLDKMARSRIDAIKRRARSFGGR